VLRTLNAQPPTEPSYVLEGRETLSPAFDNLIPKGPTTRLTQEEHVDELKLHHQGLTITEIAEELAYHPATISRLIPWGRTAA
jgi:hypothetical protein